ESSAIRPRAFAKRAANVSPQSRIAILMVPQRPVAISECSWRLIQLAEQHLGVFQICCVEAFSEAAIDIGEHRAGFNAAPLAHKQPGEAHGRAQLPSFRADAGGECDCFAKIGFSQFSLSYSKSQFAA